MMSSRYVSLILVFLSLSGCQEEIVPEPYLPSNAHEAYVHSLDQANLVDTALGRDWITLSQSALKDAVEIRSPFEEVFYVNPASAFAVAYRFEVKRGERIELECELTDDASTRVFIDLFRRTESASEQWLLVASADEEKRRLEFEPRRDNQYLVRLQPELLRGGQFRIIIRQVASMGFPVSGRGSRSILSVFGEPRDAGRRRHHGVDSFAPRHTPVLAASDSYVRHVGESDIGGRVIWLWDPKRKLHIYFAHLQSQDVLSNQWVKRGQRIGTVGNSGNARTTYPHLHFGIYARGEGPVDPFHYIHQTDSVPKAVESDLQPLGAWVRAKVQDVAIRSSWGSRPTETVTLNQHVPLKALAASRRMYRILIPDGRSGYVFARSVELAGESISRQKATVSLPVRANPLRGAVAVGWIPAGDEFMVLGRYGGYWLAKTQQGETGWLEIPTETTATLSSR
jgi:murein DD-endopeptidase MepM/ murein hydrolase activator NlpD